MIDSLKFKNQRSKLRNVIISSVLFSLIWWPLAGSRAESTPAKATGNLIVKLKADSDPRFLERYFPKKVEPLFENIYRVDVSDLNLAQTMLAGEPWVEYAEPDGVFHAAVSTNDYFFSSSIQQLDKQWYLPKIRVTEAWEKTKGSGITVAVLDTGVDGKHQDLNDGRVIAGFASYCQVVSADSGGNCLVRVTGEFRAGVNSDDSGHGTIVAGLIGAISNNNKGIAGVVGNVLIMPVKVLELLDPKDESATGFASDVALGIKWATDHGAKVINMSFGNIGAPGNKIMQDAISYAFERGVLLVAAAGNDYSTSVDGKNQIFANNLNQNPASPVCEDGGQNMVIGVAAVDSNDRKALFSDFGSDCVDITAPGAGVYVSKDNKQGLVSTYFDPKSPGEQNVYVYALGSSVSAPLVSGAAALVMSAFPDLDVKAVRDRLLASADNIDDLNNSACNGASCKDQLGRGRLNVLAAITTTPIFSGGTIIRAADGRLYLIERGLKRFVSEYVFNTRFSGVTVVQASPSQLEDFSEGPVVSPSEGVLVKSSTKPTVYLVEGEKLHALSYLAFLSRGLKFSHVVILSDEEIMGLEKGDDANVQNGVLVKTANSSAVYILNNGARQLLSFFVFQQRGLASRMITQVSAEDLSHYPVAETAFLYPPTDGTLVRGVQNATVYLFENGVRRGLTALAFGSRGYSFGMVKIISDGELGQYQLGSDILQ